MQNYPNVLPAGNSYQIPINMGRLTAAFTGAFWAMRNGTVNRLRIRRVVWTITFDGIAQPNSSLMNLTRFSGANYTGGTVIVPVKKNTSMVVSTAQDVRQSAGAALGSAGVIVEPYALISTSNQRDKGATTTEEHAYGFNESIVLNSGEGLVLVNPVASVVGDGITGYVEFDEVG